MIYIGLQKKFQCVKGIRNDFVAIGIFQTIDQSAKEILIL